MSLSRLKIWGEEILEPTDLNAEFDNILNNALSLISPLTGDLAAGGNRLTGLSLGSASSPSLQFTGDTNTGIWSNSGDRIDFSVGGIDAFTIELSSSITTATLTSTEPGVSGPAFQFNHNSATPAANDVTGRIHFIANDNGVIARRIGAIATVFDDITQASMDSHFTFQVMNAVNAGDANTTATLTSLGVWADASSEEGKTYIGDIDNVIEKMKALKTLGAYHGANVPAHKRAQAEKHYSATAEDFYSVFGLGRDPKKGDPGIAPKDVAWLAVKMALELDDRVKTLEAA